MAGVQPTNVGSVLHDAVVGTEVTLWFQAAAGLIGVRHGLGDGRRPAKRLDDLIANVE